MSLAKLGYEIPETKRECKILLLSALQEKRLRQKAALKALCEKELHAFLQYIAWPVLFPATTFKDNWHLHAICEHLQAVTYREIRNLIINIPFRSLKSTIVSQTWPAWEWTVAPATQYLTASYAKDVATRDAVDCRRIIESPLYQEFWGDKFRMTGDQNVKTRYENDRRGTRIVTSTDSTSTGFGGNRVIVDDPISVKQANSEISRLQSIEWWKGTVSNRLNNPEEDALVVTHQRTHMLDLTGHLLTEETGWECLVIPMRYEKKHTRTTCLGFKDPRKKDGELMHSERLSEPTVQAMEKRLGVYHTCAQLQQRPQYRGGGVFDSSWFGRYTVLPKIIRRCVYADTAQKTKEQNDYSVFELWGLGDDKKIYLLDMIRGKWEAHELEKKCNDFWQKHIEYDFKVSCPLTKMKVEDKSSGTGLIQYIRSKGGIPVEPIERFTDKLTRAYDGQPFMEAGLVCIPDNAPFVSDFCKEVDSFTKDDSHDHDDQIDPMLDAINDFLSSRKSIWDVI